MNEADIVTVINFMEECLFAPEQSWPKNEFERRAYSRWAANELLELLVTHPFVSTNTLIDEFIVKMSYFSHLAKDGAEKFIFAIDLAEDILSRLT